MVILSISGTSCEDSILVPRVDKASVHGPEREKLKGLGAHTDGTKPCRNKTLPQQMDDSRRREERESNPNGQAITPVMTRPAETGIGRFSLSRSSVWGSMPIRSKIVAIKSSSWTGSLSG